MRKYTAFVPGLLPKPSIIFLLRMCGLNRKLLPCLHFDNILESLIKVVLSKKVPFVHITGGKAVFRRLTGEKVD